MLMTSMEQYRKLLQTLRTSKRWEAVLKNLRQQISKMTVPHRVSQDLQRMKMSRFFVRQQPKEQSLDLMERPNSKMAQVISRSLFPVPVLILLVLIFGLLLELSLTHTTEEATESST